tara:strand:+ start:4094 stop:4261 length:168 start_codon:yes stop_codon:yes gene_type:complete
MGKIHQCLITGFGQIDIDTDSLTAYWDDSEWDILSVLEHHFTEIKKIREEKKDKD